MGTAIAHQTDPPAHNYDSDDLFRVLAFGCLDVCCFAYSCCCMLYVVIMYVDEQELTLHYCTD